MKKPKLIDFGLTQAQYEHDQRRDETIIKTIFIICFAISFIAVFIFILSETRRILTILTVTLFGGSFLGFLSSFAFGALYSALVWIFSLPRRKASAYNSAINKYSVWFIRTQKDFWDRLTGRGFEREVALLLHKAGHKATLTPYVDDKGVDIILGDGTIVQCKAHKKPVPPATARELYGTLIALSAPKAILISKSGFTTGVFAFIKNKPIELWSIDQLINIQKALAQ